MIQAALDYELENEYHIQSILPVLCANSTDGCTAFTVINGIGKYNLSETLVTLARGLATWRAIQRVLVSMTHELARQEDKID